MILLWGLTGDGPFDAVRAALQRRGAAFALVDQRLVRRIRLELRLEPELAGSIDVEGDSVSLADFDAVYWRTYDVRTIVGSDGEALQTAWALEDALATWLELTDARVINQPSAMMSNSSKPFQLEVIRAHGFDVPTTLITTEPDEVLRFWTQKSSVIYKSISGTRSVVSRIGLSHLSRLEHVATCPTQFQQFIPGTDHRVHVVGDDVFACEVLSAADDYRYAGLSGEPAELRPVRVPAEVAERCVAVTRALGLLVAGIDLRRAPDGRWFCFEVNPSPGFTYYEAHTGQPIADALSSLLVAAARPAV